MRSKIPILIFVALLFLFTKYQNFLNIKGLGFEKKSLILKKIELNLGFLNLKLFNISLNPKELKILSGNLDIKVPQERGVYPLNGFTGRDLANYIGLGLKIASSLPLKVLVKDFYINLYPYDVYVNLYGFKTVGRQTSLSFGEVSFNKSSIQFYNLSLTVFKNYLLLGGKISYNNFAFYLNADGNLKTGLKVYLNSESLGKYRGELKFRKDLILNLTGSYKNFSIDGKFSYNFRDFLALLKVNYGNLFNYFAKFFYNGLENRISLRGKSSICGKRIYFDYLKGENIESILLQSPKPKLYFITYNGEGFGYLSEGKIYLNKSLLTIKGVSFENFCGLSVKDLNFTGKFGKFLTFEGKFKHLKFFKAVGLSIANENFKFVKGDYGLDLKLKGSVSGSLFTNKALFEEDLSGNILVNNKPLKFKNLSKLNFLKSKVFSRVKYLNYSDLFEIKNVGLFAEYGKNFINGFLKGSWNGKFSIGNGFFTNINGTIYIKKRKEKFVLKTLGNKRKGNLELALSRISLSFNYRYEESIYKGLFSLNSPFLKTSGDFTFKQPKLGLKGFTSFDFKGLSGSLTSFADLDISSKDFRFSTLPFCVNLYDIKLTCFKGLLFTKKGLNVRFNLETERGFPLYIKSAVSLKEDSLNLSGGLKLDRAFLNYLLLSAGSYIENPEELKLSFSYNGKLSKFLENFVFNYSQSFDLVSNYLYKPVSLYLNANYLKGELLFLIGLVQRDTKNPYGTAELDLNFLKKDYHLSFDFSDLPVSVFQTGLFSSYLNLYLRGEGDLKGKSIKASVGVGGFVNIYGYNFPKSGRSQGGTVPLNYDMSLNTLEPLLVKFPNGEVLLTIFGNLKRETKNLKVFINYGKLDILGKKFNLTDGEVRIENEKVYLNLNLNHRTEDRTIYLHIYGYLPWQNLKLDIYSVPPAPREELIAYLVGGAGKEGAQKALGNFPLAQLITKGAYVGISQLVGALTSNLIGGVKVDFSPSFDPKTGLTFGVTVEKDFSDFASVGYRWLPSEDPKSTYLWGSLKFLYNAFFRFTRYSDGSTSLTVRFIKDFGSPF